MGFLCFLRIENTEKINISGRIESCKGVLQIAMLWLEYGFLDSFKRIEKHSDFF
jgi:ribosomal protein S8